MIPILFDTTETTFTSNGLGRLADATRCEVTEERNGQFELVLEYPVAAKMASALQCGRYIYATHDDTKTPQAFQIYKVSTPLEGVITVNAWHISYALNTIIVAPFTAGSCTAAIAGVKTNSMNTNPFTFWTDKSVTADFETTIPMSARAILGGTQGSLLDVYGTGEYEFDMFTVKLHQHRGQNRGVSIRYGKNLTKLDQDLDASNVYNSCVPYWTNDTTTVVSDTIITRTGETAGRTVTMDLSSEFETPPTLNELKAKAQTKIDASTNYQLKENLKIDFVALWQTEEYKNIANLERVYLCDTVNIFYAKLGINVTAKCIKVVYDSLRERYTAMELGEPTTSLLQEIQEQVVGDVLETVPSMSKIENAIQHATELIGGGFGGYIKFNYLPDGTPSEMLIMDSSSESTAVNIIRLNQNGLGFSTDGGSTYANAWTIDGNLNATFITTGVLDADLMTAGMIQDTSGKNYWNLDTGQFVTKQGTIGSFTIDQYGVKSGTIGEGTSGSSLLTTGLDYSYYNSGQQSTTKISVSGQTLAFSASKGNGFVPAGQITPSVSASGYGQIRIYVDNTNSPNLTMHDLDDSAATYKNEVSGSALFYDGIYIGKNGAGPFSTIDGEDATFGTAGTPGEVTVYGDFAVGRATESGLAVFDIPVKEYMGEACVQYGTDANINTLALLNSTLMAEFNSMNTYSVKRVIINIRDAFDVFTSSIVEFEIYKCTAGYGTIKGITYRVSAGVKTFYTSVYNSAINGWVSEQNTITETTVANVLTADAGITISAVEYSENGKTAMLYIAFKSSSAISVGAGGDVSNINIGTLTGGKRPAGYTAFHGDGDNASAYGYIASSGVLKLCGCKGTGTARTIAANTTLYLYATYILA